MGDNGDVREDLRVPDSDLGKEIEQKFAASEDILVSLGVCVHVLGGVCVWSVTSLFWLVVVLALTNHICLQVSVLSAMGEECAVAIKQMTGGKSKDRTDLPRQQTPPTTSL